jgi:hypothetical protein
MRAFASRQGTLYLLYRAANENSRDMTLLVSRDHAARFQIETLNSWRIKTCPMSSCAFAESNSGVVAATERDGQIGFNLVPAESLNLSRPTSVSAADKCKHPAVAASAQGEVLLAWTEGTAWEKGGALAWQVFDKSGKATAENGRTNGVPVWSLPTAFAAADGRFVIVY